jgi:transposase
LFANVDLETIAPIGSVLRVIDEMVDHLDTSDIEKEYDLESPQGQEPIHPKTLIKIALYAMHNCRFSTRKMEEDTAFNLSYRWLTGDMTIDHTTIGKFLSKYRKEIVELFAQIVEIGIEKDVIDFEVLGIDTVKIRANASYKRFRTLDGLEKEKGKIRERLKLLMENADEESNAEKEVLKRKEARVEEAIRVLDERVKQKTEGLSENEKKKVAEKSRINLTDFDCELLQQANGEINSGFSVTTSDDTGNDFITGFQLNEECNDAKALTEIMAVSEENTRRTHEVITADSGFSSMNNLEELERKEQKALIPDKRLEVEKRGETAKGEFDRSQFRYDENRDEYSCPGGQTLGKADSIVQNGRIYDRYTNKQACAVCPMKERCTKGRCRVISRDRNEQVKERMREELEKSDNKKIYALRAHTAESPFGQIKHNLKFRIFMRRGREKVAMEVALLFMLHNIMKIGKKKSEAVA